MSGSDNWFVEYLLLPLSGLIVGFLTRALTTRRERKRSDLELINMAIAPLLESIRSLTEQNSQLVEKLASEQRSTLEYMERVKGLQEERTELIAKIDKLSRQVENLKKLLKDYIKDSPSNDSDNSLNSI